MVYGIVLTTLFMIQFAWRDCNQAQGRHRQGWHTALEIATGLSEAMRSMSQVQRMRLVSPKKQRLLPYLW